MKMKKFLLTFTTAFFALGTLQAHDSNSSGEYLQTDTTVNAAGDEQQTAKPAAPERELRKKYFNFAFAGQSLRDDSGSESIKSSWGTAISTGRTFVVHRRPIADMLHIGIDATWFDLNAANYKLPLSINSYQLDISMGVGVGVHLTPVGKLGIHLYGRYNPTLGTYLVVPGKGMDEQMEDLIGGFDARLAYVSGVVTGGAVSWGLVSLGFEYRMGVGNYKSVLHKEDPKVKLTTSGWRAYFGFRF
jgi:hypothetical protein